MLVLSRTIDKHVVLNVGAVEIKITVRSAGGKGVKLVFDAPPEVLIRRGELPPRTMRSPEGSGEIGQGSLDGNPLPAMESGEAAA